MGLTFKVILPCTQKKRKNIYSKIAPTVISRISEIQYWYKQLANLSTAPTFHKNTASYKFFDQELQIQ